MRFALPSKMQNVKSERLRRSQIETAVAIFRNPDLYTLGAELVPRPDRSDGGAPRQYPDWFILAFNALGFCFGSARGVASELAADLGNGTTFYSILRGIALEVGPRELVEAMPLTPPTREWFVSRRRLITAETHERLRIEFATHAVATALEAGLLDPCGTGTRTHPDRARLIYADGKVFDPITYAPRTKKRISRYLDTETGEVVEEHVPVRFEPDAHEYETGDKPIVTGVKTWHCEVRSDFPHERVVLMVDHVPGNKDEKNSENHVAVKNLVRLAPLVPGTLGVVLDGVLRGRDIDALRKETGWIVLCDVRAQKVDPKTDERTEREVLIENVEFEYPDGKKASVQLWSVRGQLHFKDWDAEGEAFLTLLRHEEVLVRGRPGHYRHYVKVRVPDPRVEGVSKTVLVRTFNTADDAAQGLNRTEWLRDIPPLDPRFEVYGIREDAENLNNMLESVLPYRHARSYGAQNIVFDMLAHAFAINSVTRARVRRRRNNDDAAA